MITHCKAFATFARLAVLVSSVTRKATISTPGATPRSFGSLEADQAGDGRAVLRGGGHWVGSAVGEIVAGDDLVAGPEAAAQGWVVIVDAGVDDGNGHAGSVDVVGRSGGGRAGDRIVGGRGAGFDRAGGALDDRGGGRRRCRFLREPLPGVAPAGDDGDARRGRDDFRLPSLRRERSTRERRRSRADSDHPGVRAVADGAIGLAGVFSRSIP